MINNRCVNDVFAYCSDPPDSKKLVYLVREDGFDGMVRCSKGQTTCGNYHTASEVVLPLAKLLPPVGKLRRSQRQRKTT